MSPDATAVLTRWVSLAALAALVGSLVVAVVVLPVDAPETAAVRRRLTRWSRFVAGLLLVASAGELGLRARTMSGGDLAAAVAVVPSVLDRTHFGRIWIARGVALCVLLATLGRGGRPGRAATLCIALGVALSTSLVGHAADRGDLSPTALIDWLHVSAASAWSGGLFALALIVLPGARAWPAERLGTLLRRFSVLAGWCFAGVVASGLFNTWMQVGSARALWTTAYGEILGAKVVLVFAAAAFGATNRYAVLPRFPPARSAVETHPRGRARRALGGGAAARAPAARLAGYVACEAALVLLVLGCTALLTQSSPPRQPGHVLAGAAPGMEDR